MFDVSSKTDYHVFIAYKLFVFLELLITGFHLAEETRCSQSSHAFSMSVSLWTKVWSENMFTFLTTATNSNITLLHIAQFYLRSDDYMASLAKVHCLCRNWSPEWIPCSSFVKMKMNVGSEQKVIRSP